MKKIFGESHDDQIVFMDPGCASQNIGDQIISDSACSQIEPLLPGLFPFHVSTHQKMSFRYRRYLYDSTYTFVLGSNLLKGGMLAGFRQWDISLFDSFQINDAILVGCGWNAYDNRTDLYSKSLYKKILSSSHAHSVRDEYTKNKMNSLGFQNVINTGCPTLWSLSEAFCAEIPTKKANSVVYTITDYNQRLADDNLMLDTLLQEYEHVYVWYQGNGDKRYAQSLSNHSQCIPIPSTLSAYDTFLKNEDVDYVGTRLHGGIRALQHKRRALIISIDNRAGEMGKDFNLPILERSRISELDNWINGNESTSIKLKTNEISIFQSQFRNK